MAGPGGNHWLCINVKSLRGLPEVDECQPSSPFVTVRIGDENSGWLTNRTRVVHRSRNPLLEERLFFPMQSFNKTSAVHFIVEHHGTSTQPAPLGQVQTTLGQLLSGVKAVCQPIAKWLPLAPSASGGRPQGDLRVAITVLDAAAHEQMRSQGPERMAPSVLQQQLSPLHLQVCIKRVVLPGDVATVREALQDMSVEIRVGNGVLRRPFVAKDVAAVSSAGTSQGGGFSGVEVAIQEHMTFPLGDCFAGAESWSAKAQEQMRDIVIYLKTGSAVVAKTQVPITDVPMMEEDGTLTPQVPTAVLSPSEGGGLSLGGAAFHIPGLTLTPSPSVGLTLTPMPSVEIRYATAGGAARGGGGPSSPTAAAPDPVALVEAAWCQVAVLSPRSRQDQRRSERTAAEQSAALRAVAASGAGAGGSSSSLGGDSQEPSAKAHAAAKAPAEANPNRKQMQEEVVDIQTALRLDAAARVAASAGKTYLRSMQGFGRSSGSHAAVRILPPGSSPPELELCLSLVQTPAGRPATVQGVDQDAEEDASDAAPITVPPVLDGGRVVAVGPILGMGSQALFSALFSPSSDMWKEAQEAKGLSQLEVAPWAGGADGSRSRLLQYDMRVDVAGRGHTARVAEKQTVEAKGPGGWVLRLEGCFSLQPVGGGRGEPLVVQLGAQYVCVHEGTCRSKMRVAMQADGPSKPHVAAVEACVRAQLARSLRLLHGFLCPAGHAPPSGGAAGLGPGLLTPPQAPGSEGRGAGPGRQQGSRLRAVFRVRTAVLLALALGVWALAAATLLLAVSLSTDVAGLVQAVREGRGAEGLQEFASRVGHTWGGSPPGAHGRAAHQDCALFCQQQETASGAGHTEL